MKLSIVIICWNDLKVIDDCLRSIIAGTHSLRPEIIVSDNGSTDGSTAFIQGRYPEVRVLHNGANLGFAKGNNAGIIACQGEYVLILNPDTIIHDGALDRWVAFADTHPEAGAFGCRILNPDGSFQCSARPFPKVSRQFIAALYLRRVLRLDSDSYLGWDGTSEREIDWQSGCCLLVRRSLLEQLGGFDEQFFYHYEEVDLCRRVWSAGYRILYTPAAVVVHLGGQSVGRFPVRFALEKERNRYRYFYKHFGKHGARQTRYAALTSLSLRRVGFGLLNLFRRSDATTSRLAMYQIVNQWTLKLDPVKFVESGEEPFQQVKTGG